MVARTPSLDQLAPAYLGGLTHLHTVLSNHHDHRESDLSVDRLVNTLIEADLAGSPEAPLQYLMFNEHPSDPAHPKRLGPLSLRGRQLLRQRRRPIVRRVLMFYGLEVSLLPGGQTDLTPRLADHCALVIASRHALPAKTEHDAATITALFEAACQNPAVDVLGHPPRYIEDIETVPWPEIFAAAAATGTAIEVNLNTFPGANGTPLQQAFWRTWLRQLAASQALIFLGTDIHNQYQLDEFILQWRALGQPASHHENHLARFLLALLEAKITPKRIVTASADQLESWLQMDKSARARLPLGK